MDIAWISFMDMNWISRISEGYPNKYLWTSMDIYGYAG
jgi:hypothetical protein